MELERLRQVVIGNIRRTARARNTSLNKLADFAGIDRSGLYKVLRGDVALTTDQLCKISNALQCEPWELLRPVPEAAVDTARSSDTEPER